MDFNNTTAGQRFVIISEEFPQTSPKGTILTLTHTTTDVVHGVLLHFEPIGGTSEVWAMSRAIKHMIPLTADESEAFEAINAIVPPRSDLPSVNGVHGVAMVPQLGIAFVHVDGAWRMDLSGGQQEEQAEPKTKGQEKDGGPDFSKIARERLVTINNQQTVIDSLREQLRISQAGAASLHRNVEGLEELNRNQRETIRRYQRENESLQAQLRQRTSERDQLNARLATAQGNPGVTERMVTKGKLMEAINALGIDNRSALPDWILADAIFAWANGDTNRPLPADTRYQSGVIGAIYAATGTAADETPPLPELMNRRASDRVGPSDC